MESGNIFFLATLGLEGNLWKGTGKKKKSTKIRDCHHGETLKRGDSSTGQERR